MFLVVPMNINERAWMTETVDNSILERQKKREVRVYEVDNDYMEVGECDLEGKFTLVELKS